MLKRGAERIDHAIREHDFKELEEAAHGLKSGAANIGANELSRLSAELETLGEEKSLGGAEELAKQLRASLILVKSQLAAYREDGPRRGTAPSPSTPRQAITWSS